MMRDEPKPLADDEDEQEYIHSGGPGEILPPPASPTERDPDLNYDDSTHNDDEDE